MWKFEHSYFLPWDVEHNLVRMDKQYSRVSTPLERRRISAVKKICAGYWNYVSSLVGIDKLMMVCTYSNQ